MTLDVCDVTVGYRPQVEIIQGLSFSVAAGHAVGLIGPNGAGKSCLALTLAGSLTPRAGEVLVDGRPAPSGVRRRLRAGIAIVPEGRMVFGQLSVRDNVAVAAYGAGAPATPTAIDRVLARFPVLVRKAGDLAASMSGGEQQMLAVARALAQRPRYIVCDEPTLGLSPVMVDELGRVLREILADGVGLVVIEQNRHLLNAIVDTVHVMQQGRIVASVSSTDLYAADFESTYLGA